MPERFLDKKLYLDFSGYKRSKSLMKPLGKEIIPGFETTRGLNMVDVGLVNSA